MFLIGLRTIAFLFYLVNGKKRNALAFLLKAIASLKVIIPFIEYEVINRKTRACTSRHVEIQDKVFWRSWLFNSFHSPRANKAAIFLHTDQFAYMRPLNLERIKQYMFIYSPSG